MGIPGFNTYFYETNKQAYVPLQQVQVDHLYIDMNSLLHNVSLCFEGWWWWWRRGKGGGGVCPGGMGLYFAPQVVHDTGQVFSNWQQPRMLTPF